MNTLHNKCIECMNISVNCFIVLLFYYHFPFTLNILVYTEFRKLRQGSPWTLMKLLKKTIFKNIWLDYLNKYWHRQYNFNKHKHFL